MFPIFRHDLPEPKAYCFCKELIDYCRQAKPAFRKLLVKN
jgi:hypothetical protein